MLGNFTYHNATKVHFGKDALGLLGDELKNYGPKVMLSYGGGSIKRFGIYDQVVKVLREAGKTIIEDGGVLPNPDIEKVLEGARKVREEGVDLILAVGGGSTADYAKAVSASAYQERDPWDYYFKHFGKLDSRWTPVGVVLTMAGTGSEMNSGSVISSHKEELKLFNHFRNPDFAILNPEFTYTVPKYHMVAGIYDIMSHILEQYLSGSDDNTSDYLAEGLMRSLIVSSRKALVNPEDYEARSNIMWTATWGLNGLTECGKATDWEVHMLGTGRGSLYQCHPWPYALGSLGCLLPPADREERRGRGPLQAPGPRCMGRTSRGQGRQGRGPRRTGDDGVLDARTRPRHDHHGGRCQGSRHRKVCRCLPPQYRWLPHFDPRRSDRDLSPQPVVVVP